MKETALTELTQAKLKELLHYEPETGVFTWKVNRGGTARAGSQAGTLCKVRGYWQISVFNRLHQTHRLAWFYVHGRWPECLDHINRIRTDNRISNLREVTRSQNLQNSTVVRGKLSGYRGVTWCRATRSWRAQIKASGKHYDLGRYATPEQAYAAYLAGAARYHTHNPLVAAATPP